MMKARSWKKCIFIWIRWGYGSCLQFHRGAGGIQYSFNHLQKESSYAGTCLNNHLDTMRCGIMHDSTTLFDHHHIRKTKEININPTIPSTCSLGCPSQHLTLNQSPVIWQWHWDCTALWQVAAFPARRLERGQYLTLILGVIF